MAAIGAAFWLGWLAATRNTSPSAAGPPSPTPSGDSSADRLQLHLDAGGLTLLPDAGLHLKPLPTLDPDALYRDALDAGDSPPPPP